MILVDSSVWIDYFRSADTAQVALLDSLFGRSPLAVGDLIAAEVLQGVRDEREFKLVKKTLDAFDHIDLAGYDLAVQASENIGFCAARASRFAKPSTRSLPRAALKTD